MIGAKGEKRSVQKILFFLIIACLFVSARPVWSGMPDQAESEAGEEESPYSLYFLSHDETHLDKMPYHPDQAKTSFMRTELGSLLNSREKRGNSHALFPAQVQISSWFTESDLLNLVMTQAYKSMDPSREILTRVGLVRCFCQLEDVKGLCLWVGTEPLRNPSGEKVGEIRPEDIVELWGEETDAYRYDSFTLYFTDQKSTLLIPEKRNVYYPRSLPRERIILEQLIQGPVDEGHYPTLPNTIQINDIQLFEGVCYVDLSRSFIGQALDIPSLICVYSIVNTLTGNDSIQDVRIMVDSEEKISLNDISLYQYFRKNEALIGADLS